MPEGERDNRAILAKMRPGLPINGFWKVLVWKFAGFALRETTKRREREKRDLIRLKYLETLIMNSSDLVAALLYSVTCIPDVNS